MRVPPRSAALACLLAVSGMAATAAAGPVEVAERVRDWRMAHEQQLVDRFAALLSIPNVARDRAHIRRNAEHIGDLLEAAGMEVRLLEVADANPAVFAQRLVPGAARTVMIYIHYDGQPVNPADWASEPWTPVLRTDSVENGGREVPMQGPFDPEWRIFARSAGDDKAPIIALQGALQALAWAGLEPTVNLKVFLDGEEEAGSPNLRRVLETHAEALAADLWLFCDGPMHQSRRPQLVYGVRGSYGLNLTVYGANRPLHSGHYGNWAPNPILLLSELLLSMRDSSGQVLIEGFYDQVRGLSAAEQAAVDASPRMDDLLKLELGIAQPETGDRIEQAILRPGLNLRGISSGGVGAASRNAIHPHATASIGLRLVPDQTPAQLSAVLERHVRAQGFHILSAEPTPAERVRYPRLARLDWSGSGGYPAYRAPFDHPLARQVSALLNELADGTLIQTPTMGGSLPIYIVDEVLATPVLILPVANHDNNQHGANENLRLQNLWDAIETYAAVLTGL
ncbi:MAG: M20/M25/M40 family metallo-hydrolase [Xanthomonadales bacterium]|nr:M20/M25/M40 family metallo-hydrolase [Xanthomonadales bacterium]NIO13869.1 M20/M25/M40 family metallo-hydrolase [Xanthomonadales bacterium]NIP76142.1 M20/M25/M40 family metallo-hydrolase [Xanthomonadales bacterium]NIT07591.1 M20/M25/M40 family metallo-hydrolase [Xanthomonadales bacterium]